MLVHIVVDSPHHVGLVLLSYILCTGTYSLVGRVLVLVLDKKYLYLNCTGNIHTYCYEYHAPPNEYGINRIVGCRHGCCCWSDNWSDCSMTFSLLS